jgi:hypothetical protein
MLFASHLMQATDATGHIAPDMVTCDIWRQVRSFSMAMDHDMPSLRL